MQIFTLVVRHNKTTLDIVIYKVWKADTEIIWEQEIVSEQETEKFFSESCAWKQFYLQKLNICLMFYSLKKISLLASNYQALPHMLNTVCTQITHLASIVIES